MRWVDFLGSYEWFFNLIQYCQARFIKIRQNMLEICCTFRFQNDIFSMTLSLLQKKNEGQEGKGNGNALGKGMRWGVVGNWGLDLHLVIMIRIISLLFWELLSSIVSEPETIMIEYRCTMFTGVQEATILVITRFAMSSVKWYITISNKHKNI